MIQFINYIKHTLIHKLSFWTWGNLKKKLIEHGPTFLIILIIVELIEHLGLPVLFYYLGENIHDFFYVLIPAPLVVCLHFLTAPLVFFIYMLITKKKNSIQIKISDFYNNALKLFASISIAQIIPIIILPLLTQYFSAEQFGVYGLYISICSILGLIASGKYDVAIMLPKKQIDAFNILVLCCLIAFLFSTLCFSILNIFNDLLFEKIQSEILHKYYFIIPISIFLISINQSMVVWLNRKKQYNTIASQNILKSSSNSAASLILGMKKIYTGLISGYIISLISITLWNMYKLKNDIKIKQINLKIMGNNFRKYIKFLKFSTPSSLFNSFSTLGMTTLIIAFFGAEIAGFYFLAEKLVAIPISFITSSISQVYFEKASKLFHSNKKELLRLTNEIQNNIYMILFPLLIIASVFGENIFSILGKEWASAGSLIKYFSVYILLRNLYSPISHIGDILNKQKTLLIFNMCIFILQVGSFYLLKDHSNIKIALLTASVFGAIGYLILDTYMKQILIKRS